jgi:hypothetical protein
MAHAQLELNVNCSPTIALKVLSAARTSYPSAACDVRYVCMLCRVLTLLGDLKQIRWIFQTIIGEAVVITPPAPLVAGAANLVTSGLTEITSGFGDKGNARGPKPTTPGSGTYHLVCTDLDMYIPFYILDHFCINDPPYLSLTSLSLYVSVECWFQVRRKDLLKTSCCCGRST